MQESVKHFLWHRDRQMAQFGGGEERPPVAAALVPGSPLPLSPDSLPLSVRSANFMADAGSVRVPLVAPASTITEAPTSSAKDAAASASGGTSSAMAVGRGLRNDTKSGPENGRESCLQSEFLCLLWPPLPLCSRLTLAPSHQHSPIWLSRSHSLARYSIIWFAIRLMRRFPESFSGPAATLAVASSSQDDSRILGASLCTIFSSETAQKPGDIDG